MSVLIKFVHFILYSNLWIAIAAVCMTAKTIYLMGMDYWVLEPVYGFVFCATLFIYAGHRVIGLRKSEAFIEEGRYKVIAEHKSHIVLYALLGLIGTIVFAWMLSWTTWLVMAIPGFISLAYIFPMFSGKDKKRLRDIDDVKIYFVSLVWMMVNVVLPYVELGGDNYMFLILSMLEVFLFVFAITIPFDIRDLSVDGYNEVKTIPARFGVKASKRLSIGLLFLSFLSEILNIYCHELTNTTYWSTIMSYVIGYSITYLLILNVNKDKPDYYYTGFLDGTMILLPLIVIFL